MIYQHHRTILHFQVAYDFDFLYEFKSGLGKKNGNFA